ncbi:hypothetical protein LV84_03477 [Algoriphagus ratkowskyi]|uniref:Uncharacterized protein n=1 Tax=Algoriphagus ratkowskyi TaxID=57028 RepID=A0A2W7R2J7_9BACT|nr:hypothetical protein LV84_03477 [Algoriphagus ratkowskyi]
MKISSAKKNSHPLKEMAITYGYDLYSCQITAQSLKTINP